MFSKLCFLNNLFPDILKKIKSIVNPSCSTPPHVSSENRSFTSTITVEEIGNRFKFVEREAQMKKYRELIQRAFELWQTYHHTKQIPNNNYKKNLIIPVIGGASGIGKTRFLSEIVRWMKDRVNDANSPFKKIHSNNETTDEQKADLDRFNLFYLLTGFLPSFLYLNPLLYFYLDLKNV